MKTEYRNRARNKRKVIARMNAGDDDGIDQLIDLAVKSDPAVPPADRQDVVSRGRAVNEGSRAMVEPRH